MAGPGAAPAQSESKDNAETLARDEWYERLVEKVLVLASVVLGVVTVFVVLLALGVFE